MLGNAPTRMVTCPQTGTIDANQNPSTNSRLFILPPGTCVDHHRKNFRRFFALVLPFAWLGLLAVDDVRQGGVIENARGGVAHIEKYLIKRAMLGIAINQTAQLFGIAEGSQSAVNQANDLAE